MSGYEKRRQATRQRILDTAFQLFADNRYDSISIDGIAGAAGVSRQTVYEHFGNKLGVVHALTAAFLDQANAQFFALASYDTLSPANLRAWLRDRVELMRANTLYLRLFIQVAMAERDYDQTRRARHSAIMKALAAKIPVFDLACSDRDEGRTNIRAHLVLDQLDMFCTELALGWDVNECIAIEVMAEELHRFIHQP